MLSRRSLTAGLGALATLGSFRARAAGKSVTYWSHNYPSLLSIVDDTMVPGFQIGRAHV